jgi:hypothetical protein
MKTLRADGLYFRLKGRSTYIDNVIDELIDCANVTGQKAMTVFNAVILQARPGDSAERLQNLYWRKIDGRAEGFSG